MRYQPWLSSDDWECGDPKLVEATKQPVRLPHTSDLVNAIDIRPAGVLVVRGPRQVGKSTFLREYAVKALKNGLSPDRIVHEFLWAQKVLPPDRSLKVITKKTNAVGERIELIALERWLRE
jgi:hypothetical protein